MAQCSPIFVRLRRTPVVIVDLDQWTWPAANEGPIFRFVGPGAAGSPATNYRHRHWNAAAKAVTRTVVATISAAVATVPATSVASAAVSRESVVRDESAAQY